jgi:hypothetical protein
MALEEVPAWVPQIVQIRETLALMEGSLESQGKLAERIETGVRQQHEETMAALGKLENSFSLKVGEVEKRHECRLDKLETDSRPSKRERNRFVIAVVASLFAGIGILIPLGGWLTSSAERRVEHLTPMVSKVTKAERTLSDRVSQLELSLERRSSAVEKFQLYLEGEVKVIKARR